MKRRYLVRFIIIRPSNQVKSCTTMFVTKVLVIKVLVTKMLVTISKGESLVLRSKKAPVFIRGTRHRQRLSRPQSPDRTKVRIGPLMKSFETRFDQNDDLNQSRSQSQGCPDRTKNQFGKSNRPSLVDQQSGHPCSKCRTEDPSSTSKEFACLYPKSEF